MYEQEPGGLAWQLASRLVQARNETEAATAVAQATTILSGAEQVRVWLIDHSRGYRYSGSWPDEAEPPREPPDDVARSVVFCTPVAAAAGAAFRSRLSLPLFAGPRPLGAVELLEEKRAAGPFTSADASLLAELMKAADSALQSVRDRAVRERKYLEVVTRLTRLFDIGRSFARTLELDKLVEVIASRTRAALEVENAYIWLLSGSGETLTVVAAVGTGAEAVREWQLAGGRGLAGRVAASGESLLIDRAQDVPEIEERPDCQAGLEIDSCAAAPVVSEDGTLLGVLEVVNKEAEASLNDEDLAYLKEVAETAAIAIGNARRLDAERKASDLGALLDTAQELGSSLDVRKVAFTLVHKAASVIPYRRAGVGLLKGTGFGLTAVSGQSFVDEKLPEMKALRDLLAWGAGLEEGTYVVQHEDGTIDADRPETREKFRAYFEMTGARSFLTVPLRDDEGSLGTFGLESSQPYAFQERDLEAAQLLGVAATIAIRNATLYQQIPMMRVIQPLARHKQRFLSLPLGRRIAWSVGMAVLTAALVLVRVPLRVGGEARLLPSRRVPVTAGVDGRISQVLVREGDHVVEGQLLALLEDSDYRAGREDARARYEVELREQSRQRAAGSAAGAAVQTARLDGLRAEMDLWRTRLERTRIRAGFAGIVATPRVEELVGTRLARGDVLCEVVEPARQDVEIAVPEWEAGRIAAGQPVKVMFYAFPDRSFRGEVERIGVSARLQEGQRMFMVRAELVQAAAQLRSGMAGKAKISTGEIPLGWVILRRPVRWLWGLVWGWLP
ncbi:MAG: hypothetical protein DMF49_02800 [Acidobacteria bacterium]|nr:MAG: hypothetical protein DMF49_02800 [Acidobacteriota bacterium]